MVAQRIHRHTRRRAGIGVRLCARRVEVNKTHHCSVRGGQGARALVDRRRAREARELEEKR